MSLREFSSRQRFSGVERDFGEPGIFNPLDTVRAAGLRPDVDRALGLGALIYTPFGAFRFNPFPLGFFPVFFFRLMSLSVLIRTCFVLLSGKPSDTDVKLDALSCAVILFDGLLMQNSVHMASAISSGSWLRNA